MSSGPASYWVLILAVAVLTAVLMASGPVRRGGRDLPPRFSAVVALLAAPLMAALVVTSLFADGREFQVSADAAGVGVAGLLLWRRVPVIVAVVVAAGTTAALRLVGLP
jgi:branched-subunit amino acid transport protein